MWGVSAVVSLTAQLSVWLDLCGRMKDRARRGPTQSTGLKVGFPQLVRIMKKCVGEPVAPFLEDKGTRSGTVTPEK